MKNRKIIKLKISVKDKREKIIHNIYRVIGKIDSKIRWFLIKLFLRLLKKLSKGIYGTDA
jgi:rRNA processing protein Gar1